MADTPITAPTPALTATATPTPGAAPAPTAKPTTAAAVAATGAEKIPGTDKFTIKIDGKEQTLTRDQLIVLAQKGAGADAKFREASTLRSQAQELIALAKSNPQKFFEQTGIDGRKLSESVLMEHLKREMESPEARTQREQAEELQRYKAKEAEEKKAAAEKAHAEATQRHMENFQNIVISALKTSGLPNSPETVVRCARAAQAMAKAGLDAFDPRNAPTLVSYVKDSIKAELGALLRSDTEGAALEELLGEIGVKTLTRRQIAKLKARASDFGGSGGGKPPRAEAGATGDKPMTWSQFQKRNRGIGR